MSTENALAFIGLAFVSTFLGAMGSALLLLVLGPSAALLPGLPVQLVKGRWLWSPAPTGSFPSLRPPPPVISALSQPPPSPPWVLTLFRKRHLV